MRRLLWSGFVVALIAVFAIAHVSAFATDTSAPVVPPAAETPTDEPPPPPPTDAPSPEPTTPPDAPSPEPTTPPDAPSPEPTTPPTSPGGGSRGGGCDDHDLVLTKTVDQPTAAVGDIVTFTLTTTYATGTCDAEQIVVSDTLPGILALQYAVASFGEVSISGNTVTVTIPAMFPGDVVTITVVARATTPGTAPNNAILTVQTNDDNRANNRASVTVTVVDGSPTPTASPTAADMTSPTPPGAPSITPVGTVTPTPTPAPPINLPETGEQVPPVQLPETGAAAPVSPAVVWVIGFAGMLLALGLLLRRHV